MKNLPYLKIISIPFLLVCLILFTPKLSYGVISIPKTATVETVDKPLTKKEIRAQKKLDRKTRKLEKKMAKLNKKSKDGNRRGLKLLILGLILLLAGILLLSFASAGAGGLIASATTAFFRLLVGVPLTIGGGILVLVAAADAF